MHLARLKPLAVALGIGLITAGCATQNVKPAAAPAAAPLAGTIPAGAAQAFAVSDLDPSIAACQDFNGFVNAKWVAANPIPADETR